VAQLINYKKKRGFKNLQLADLKNSLAEVLALEQTDEALAGIVDTLGDIHGGLEGALAEPLLDLLLVLAGVPGAHVGITNNEAAHGQALGDDLHEVADGVLVLGLEVVLGDHAAGDDATKVVHAGDGGLELLTADVLVVDVDTVGGQALEGVKRLLLLVVEAGVEVKVLGDEVELLVVTDGADDGEALVLGELADELADGTGGGGDEDGLALLGDTNIVEGRVGGQTGHAEGTEEELGVKLVGVVDDIGGVGDLLGEGSVLGGGSLEEGADLVAGLELLVVALDDSGNAAVGDGGVQLKGGSVGLDVAGTHAATLVGVEGDIVDLDGDAALGRGLLGVECVLLDANVLAGDDLLAGVSEVCEGLVLNHDGGGVGSM
jgi:hypothetical protein